MEIIKSLLKDYSLNLKDKMGLANTKLRDLTASIHNQVIEFDKIPAANLSFSKYGAAIDAHEIWLTVFDNILKQLDLAISEVNAGFGVKEETKYLECSKNTNTDCCDLPLPQDEDTNDTESTSQNFNAYLQNSFHSDTSDNGYRSRSLSFEEHRRSISPIEEADEITAAIEESSNDIRSNDDTSSEENCDVLDNDYLNRYRPRQCVSYACKVMESELCDMPDLTAELNENKQRKRCTDSDKVNIASSCKDVPVDGNRNLSDNSRADEKIQPTLPTDDNIGSSKNDDMHASSSTGDSHPPPSCIRAERKSLVLVADESVIPPSSNAHPLGESSPTYSKAKSFELPVIKSDEVLPHANPSSTDSPPSYEEVIAQQMKHLTLSDVPPALTLPSELKYIRVVVAHVASNNEFYCHMIETGDSLTKINMELNKFAEGKAAMTTLPSVNTIVCARYNDDNWYRAKVLSVHRVHKLCNVLFCDYGNRCSLRVEDIRHIDRKFLEHPFYAIHCISHQIQPIDANFSFFHKKCLKEDLEIVVVKKLAQTEIQHVKVNLYYGADRKNFLKLLVDMSLAEYGDTESIDPSEQGWGPISVLANKPST